MTVLAQPKPRREERVKREPIDWRGFQFPRPTTARDRKFARDAVRRYDCAIRGREKHKCGPKLDAGKVLLDFAHIPTNGQRAMARKGGERGGGIVLCRFAHMLQHSIGWPRFIEKYHIDPKAIAMSIAEALNRDER